MPQPNGTAKMKFLIIRFSSIGDIVLMTPVFRILKTQLPDCTIHFITKKNFKAVTQDNPYIDKFIYYDNNLSEIITAAKFENYTAILDLHNNFRTLRIKLALHKTPEFTINKENFRKELLTRWHIDIMLKRHITLRSIDVLQGLKKIQGLADKNWKDDEKGLDFFLPKSPIELPKNIENFTALPYIAIVLGASYITKKMPLPKLAAIIQLLPNRFVLIGGDTEEKEGDFLAQTFPDRVFNTCGKCTLAASALLVQRAQLVISNDTGFLYIACALRRPTIAVWGSTSPALDVEAWYPGDYAYSFENVVSGIACQPCSKYGVKRCPKKHFNCMNSLDSKAIAQLVQNFIQKTNLVVRRNAIL